MERLSILVRRELVLSCSDEAIHFVNSKIRAVMHQGKTAFRPKLLMQAFIISPGEKESDCLAANLE